MTDEGRDGRWTGTTLLVPYHWHCTNFTLLPTIRLKCGRNWTSLVNDMGINYCQSPFIKGTGRNSIIIPLNTGSPNEADKLTKMCVSIGWEHLEDSIVNCQQSYIKRTTTEIKHQDVLLAFFLVQAVSNSCSCPESTQNTGFYIYWNNTLNSYAEVNTNTIKTCL